MPAPPRGGATSDAQGDLASSVLDLVPDHLTESVGRHTEGVGVPWVLGRRPRPQTAASSIIALAGGRRSPAARSRWPVCGENALRRIRRERERVRRPPCLTRSAPAVW